METLKATLEISDDDLRSNTLYDLALDASFKIEWLTKPKKDPKKVKKGGERMMERAQVKRPRKHSPVAAASV